MSVLLDTNVLSELLRAQPDPIVLAWVASLPTNSAFVSAVTQAEMMLGAALLPAGKRRQRLEQALDAMFREDFAGHILPFDAACAAHYSWRPGAARARRSPSSTLRSRPSPSVIGCAWRRATPPISKAAVWR
jgi:toxin FitB